MSVLYRGGRSNHGLMLVRLETNQSINPPIQCLPPPPPTHGYSLCNEPVFHHKSCFSSTFSLNQLHVPLPVGCIAVLVLTIECQQGLAVARMPLLHQSTALLAVQVACMAAPPQGIVSTSSSPGSEAAAWHAPCEHACGPPPRSNPQGGGGGGASGRHPPQESRQLPGAGHKLVLASIGSHLRSRAGVAAAPPPLSPAGARAGAHAGG